MYMHMELHVNGRCSQPKLCCKVDLHLHVYEKIIFAANNQHSNGEYCLHVCMHTCTVYIRT